MGEESSSRNEFIGRIGTFFIVIGLLALFIFISSDISRTKKVQQLEQENTALAAYAIQTREAGAALALQQNLPTPTLMPVDDLRATREYVAFAVQALQTRDVDAQKAQLLNLPSPTMIPAELLSQREQSISYFSLFCIGSLAVSGGLILWRMTAPPAKPSSRFEGVRKWQQKRRETKARREAAQKEKSAQKKK